MASPISPRARAYVRSRATQVMEYEVLIQRPGKMGHDSGTLVAQNASPTDLYQGKARIWDVSSGNTVVIGETETLLQNTFLSIPWDTEVLIRKGDQVEVLAAPQDSEMVGRRFKINSKELAGELRATRRFSLTLLAEQK